MIRRRRECLACSHRYTPYEQVEYELLTVIKRDGRREPFTREKLMSGIRRACQIAGENARATTDPGTAPCYLPASRKEFPACSRA